METEAPPALSKLVQTDVKSFRRAPVHFHTINLDSSVLLHSQVWTREK